MISAYSEPSINELQLHLTHVRTDRPVLPPRWHAHQHSRKAAQEAGSPAPHRLRTLPRYQVPREATQRDHRHVLDFRLTL